MVPSAQQAAVRLQKHLSVWRCGSEPDLHWWSLPFSLKQFARVFAADLRGAQASVVPADALDAVDAALLAVSDELPEPSGGAVGVQVAPELRQATPGKADTLRLGDVSALLGLADGGRVSPCRITIEQQIGTTLCTIQVPELLAEQPQYRFHRSGDALRVIETLTLGRRFGADPVRTEQDLLRHGDFSNGTKRSLHLVLEKGEARLEAVQDGGRRHTCYLESGRGYRGSSEIRSRWQVWRESWKEERRRFPVKVVLFAGLPVFIGIFRAGAALLRRGRP